MPKVKKFDKKKAVTFQLVHRSQQDPLIVDEDAPQRVLVPIEQPEKKSKDKCNDDTYDDASIYLRDSKENRLEWPDLEEELIKRRNKSKVSLPQSVFASKIEEDIGMLAKAAPVSGPQLNLDPDIVAAMDDDFDYDDPQNQLEDDFIGLANGITSDQEHDSDLNSNFESESMEDVESLKSKNFDEEETKSRFTNYSVTSSVIRRNDQLTLLDERFEKMYAGYEDNEIGALDCEEIEGYVPDGSQILLEYAKEFDKMRKLEKIDNCTLADKIKEQLEKDSEEGDELISVPVLEKEKWDCESILSTYSNLYNHPKLIAEPKKDKIQINSKTGIPMDVLNCKKLTSKALNKLNMENSMFENRITKLIDGQSLISQLSTLSIRPKDETPEERKERKRQLKEIRRERRLEKKSNSIAFKDEMKRQSKIAINNKNNVQGNKLL